VLSLPTSRPSPLSSQFRSSLFAENGDGDGGGDGGDVDEDEDGEENGDGDGVGERCGKPALAIRNYRLCTILALKT
jgi:hypothetical protein